MFLKSFLISLETLEKSKELYKIPTSWGIELQKDPNENTESQLLIVQETL